MAARLTGVGGVEKSGNCACSHALGAGPAKHVAAMEIAWPAIAMELSY